MNEAHNHFYNKYKYIIDEVIDDFELAISQYPASLVEGPEIYEFATKHLKEDYSNFSVSFPNNKIIYLTNNNKEDSIQHIALAITNLRLVVKWFVFSKELNDRNIFHKIYQHSNEISVVINNLAKPSFSLILRSNDPQSSHIIHDDDYHLVDLDLCNSLKKDFTLLISVFIQNQNFLLNKFFYGEKITIEEKDSLNLNFDILLSDNIINDYSISYHL